jgi:hypothetical protein
VLNQFRKTDNRHQELIVQICILWIAPKDIPRAISHNYQLFSVIRVNIWLFWRSSYVLCCLLAATGIFWPFFAMLYSKWRKKEPRFRFKFKYLSTYLRKSLHLTGFTAQIREQMSGPDLHAFTLKFLNLQKTVFFTFSGTVWTLLHNQKNQSHF